MDFGKQVRTLRTVRGLSQEELAKLVGISRVYITGIENGTMTPNESIADRIRTALDWPANTDEAFAILAGKTEASHG